MGLAGCIAECVRGVLPDAGFITLGLIIGCSSYSNGISKIKCFHRDVTGVPKVDFARFDENFACNM